MRMTERSAAKGRPSSDQTRPETTTTAGASRGRQKKEQPPSVRVMYIPEMAMEKRLRSNVESLARTHPHRRETGPPEESHVPQWETLIVFLQNWSLKILIGIIVRYC